MSWADTARIAKDNADRQEARAAQERNRQLQAALRRDAVAWRQTQHFAEAVTGRTAERTK